MALHTLLIFCFLSLNYWLSISICFLVVLQYQLLKFAILRFWWQFLYGDGYFLFWTHSLLLLIAHYWLIVPPTSSLFTITRAKRFQHLLILLRSCSWSCLSRSLVFFTVNVLTLTFDNFTRILFAQHLSKCKSGKLWRQIPTFNDHFPKCEIWFWNDHLERKKKCILVL